MSTPEERIQELIEMREIALEENDQRAVMYFNQQLKPLQAGSAVRQASREESEQLDTQIPGMGYVEDMARSVLPGIDQGTRYIRDPVNMLLNKIPGYERLAGAIDDTVDITEHTGYEPKTFAGRQTKALSSGLSSAAFPIAGQAAYANALAQAGKQMTPLLANSITNLPGKLSAPTRVPSMFATPGAQSAAQNLGQSMAQKEAVGAATGASLGQSFREIAPHDLPFREPLAVGVEALGGSMAGVASDVPEVSRISRIPFIGNRYKKGLKWATEGGREQLYEESLRRNMGELIDPDTLASSPRVKGQALTTARASGDRRAIAIEQNLRGKPDFDTTSIDNVYSNLKGAYKDTLTAENIAEAPSRAKRALLDDLSSFLAARLPSKDGKPKWSIKVAKEWYDENQELVDQVPELKDLFSGKGAAFKVKGAVEQSFNDRNIVRNMGYANPSEAANVWSRADPIQSFNDLMEGASKPRQQQAVRRLVYESFMDSITGEKVMRELTDKEAAEHISAAVLDLWEKPGGKAFLHEILPQHTILALEDIAEHGKQFLTKAAKGTQVPEPEIEGLRDIGRIYGAGMVGWLYNKTPIGRVMSGQLAAGSVGSKKVQSWIVKKTVGPHHAKVVRFFADKDFAEQIMRANVDPEELARRIAKLKKQYPAGIGRYAPALTPTGEYPEDRMKRRLRDPSGYWNPAMR